MPPGSCARTASSPRTIWIDALRFDPASVSSSVPLRKVERGESELARELRAGRQPFEAAGDHQMDDDEEIGFEPDHDPLAEAANAMTRLPASSDGGGSTVRSTNGLPRRSLSSG